MKNFHCTVHPKKKDKWWPTCISFDIQAGTVTAAKAQAWNMAIQAGMLGPRIVKAVQREVSNG